MQETSRETSRIRILSTLGLATVSQYVVICGFSRGWRSHFYYSNFSGVVIVKIKKANRPRFGDRDPDEMIRLSKLLNEMEQRLGRKPKKSDVDNKDLWAIRKCFGKWCYALEAAGLKMPSPETIERRMHRKTKIGRKRAAQKERIRRKFLPRGDI